MLQHMGYLWAASAVVWLVTLGYVFLVLRKQDHLEQELGYLKQALDDLKETTRHGSP